MMCVAGPSLMQDGDLVLDAVLLALQGFLRDALDGHQLLGPLLLGQDHLGESSPETQTTQPSPVRLYLCLRPALNRLRALSPLPLSPDPRFRLTVLMMDVSIS